MKIIHAQILYKKNELTKVLFKSLQYLFLLNTIDKTGEDIVLSKKRITYYNN